ncbi:MAG: nucleotide exchange factor GrpE [Bacteroidales bacterium]|nr:nucleotide exchange factor GrpE [Bacteroidales bacterium]
MSKKEHNKTETEETVNQHPESEEAVEQASEEIQEETATEPTEADKLQEMGEKLATLNDKYLRLYSEYENYRKRTNVEKADLLLNGSREMMKAILPVVDDFERALAATGDDEGVKLIYSKLMKILEQKGLKAMEAKGEKFDESMHEAVTQIPAPAPEQKGLVIDVVEKGYYLNDKVLRYAKVVVAC